MEGLDEWLPPASAGTETGLQTAQVIFIDATKIRLELRNQEVVNSMFAYPEPDVVVWCLDC
jgi:hypothetical protein